LPKRIKVLLACAVAVLGVYLAVWMRNIAAPAENISWHSAPPQSAPQSKPAESAAAPKSQPSLPPESPDKTQQGMLTSENRGVKESASQSKELAGSSSQNLLVDTKEAPEFSVAPLVTSPGGMLVIKARGVEDGTSIKLDSPFGKTLRFFDVGSELAALVGVGSWVKPGDYSLNISAPGGGKTISVTVLAREFEEQYLTVEQSVVDKTIGSDEANAQYREQVRPLKYVYDDAPLWQGEFILPIKESFRITTAFGMRRTTNGVPGERHGGIDYACPTGTPVYASNAGVVKLAKAIMMTGNTVLIEHGMGLKSWYYHMNTLDVTPGQKVKKGQVIGTVGSTGFSTGPHLHFAISVFDEYVDPEPFYKRAPPI
jgi:murein DD-endopeptidase MepM/ murein hydrolase activator NlpD